MFNTILGAILITAPIAAASLGSVAAMQQNNHKTIKAEELKSWYDQKKPMIVLDARSEKYFDGRLLPNAKWLPSESSESEIQSAIPSKNDLVVVYCLGVKCPASGWLYDKLIRIYAPLEICYERVKSRDQNAHIHVSEELLKEINENAVRATFDWDLELDNSDKLTALEIVREFTSINNGNFS